MKKCCETCWHRDSEPHEEPCISCRYDNDVPSLWKEAEWYEPDTNADRIRAMSDEELALFVRTIIRAEDCPAIGCDCDKCFFKEPCFNGSKWHGKETEWLKQPAKGE